MLDYILGLGIGGVSPPPMVGNTGVTTFDNVTTTTTANAPSGTTVAGDFLLLFIASVDFSSGVRDQWITPPAGWTRIGCLKSSFTSVTAFYKVAAGGEGNVTITNDQGIGQYGVAYYSRYTGIDPLDPINTVWLNFTTAGTPFSPAGSGGSTTVENCLGVSMVGARQSSGATVSVSGTGWAKQQGHANPNTDVITALSIKTMTAIGIQDDITFTASSAPTEWACMTVALNPLSAADEAGYPVLQSYTTAKSAADTPVTSFNISPPASIVAGDMLVLMVNAGTNTAGYSCTTPSGWTLIRATGNSTTDAYCTMFYKIATGGETTITVSQSSARHVAWWARITGCSGFDVSNGFNDTGSSQMSLMGALVPTTTRAKCLLLGHGCIRNGVNGTDLVFGGGNIVLHAEDTCANTLSNSWSMMMKGKAARIGSHGGDLVAHSRVTGANSGQEHRTAIMAAFYP